MNRRSYTVEHEVSLIFDDGWLIDLLIVSTNLSASFDTVVEFRPRLKMLSLRCDYNLLAMPFWNLWFRFLFLTHFYCDVNALFVENTSLIYSVLRAQMGSEFLDTGFWTPWYSRVFLWSSQKGMKTILNLQCVYCLLSIKRRSSILFIFYFLVKHIPWTTYNKDYRQQIYINITML